MKKELKDYNLTEVRSYILYLQRQYVKALEIMVTKSPSKKDVKEITNFVETTFDTVDSWKV